VIDSQRPGSTDYLADLTWRLAMGASRIDDQRRERHLAFFLRNQREDGGFPGRDDGDSDLYYTGFGARSLAVLGGMTPECVEKIADFLRSRLSGRESIVDLFSLIYAASIVQTMAEIDVFGDSRADWRTALEAHFASLRRDDGGFAKAPAGHVSSTYHTFLVILCLQLIGSDLPEPTRIVDFIRDREAEDGGFHEIRVSKRAGTNPTAAAVAALRMLDGLDDGIRHRTTDFLIDMQTDEGGLRANTRIPIADVLSTFTGMVTLADLDALDELDLARVARYVDSLEHEQGGFHGAVWDEHRDVEYSFYGIGCLAILNGG
jgi:geranylgeranyl transferase type-2 subunit beta